MGPRFKRVLSICHLPTSRAVDGAISTRGIAALLAVLLAGAGVAAGDGPTIGDVRSGSAQTKPSRYGVVSS